VAKNLTFSRGMANALITAIQAYFDAGFLDIYDGTQPANPNNSSGSANLLARVDLPADAFDDTASLGAIQLKGSWTEAAAILNGTATWFRLRESTDTGGASTAFVRIDGTCGITAGQFDLVLTSVNVVSGEPVEIDLASLFLPTA